MAPTENCFKKRGFAPDDVEIEVDETEEEDELETPFQAEQDLVTFQIRSCWMQLQGRIRSMKRTGFRKSQGQDAAQSQSRVT